jgi:hypothetical protein
MQVTRGVSAREVREGVGVLLRLTLRLPEVPEEVQEPQPLREIPETQVVLQRFFAFLFVGERVEPEEPEGTMEVREIPGHLARLLILRAVPQLPGALGLFAAA